MKTITVVSPDKISLNMFFGFLKIFYGSKIGGAFISLNSLYSSEFNDSTLEGFFEKHNNSEVAVILYMTKKNVSLENTTSLRSSYFEDQSSLIVSLDLYSVTPRVLKDTVGEAPEMLKSWEMFIKKVEKN